MMIPDKTIFESDASDRLVRIFLVGLIIGASAGAILGGLAAVERLNHG